MVSSSYHRIISEVAPELDAAEVEEFMRGQYGTLDHLPRSVFVRECNLYREVAELERRDANAYLQAS